ncbi:hypothetical protein ACWT_3415 [Actinoplanes sp. SE50]|uniref:TY-Chap domain-containing protein n=1 Tax=unclassified Actinoplanes TaxID=2626549 RepID=UPI00023ED433|nr:MULTISPECIES: hypothetical protein [unclassified Actinoplanes]AEV84438.1 hypothetical protein ACPL_3543 [Actinoplanes sp. SE50/110]ATO82830.1 hypothetical protein ACWT_3415 [Actinoplanes sp. SE50]SLM00238.1 hypothetical protein ACSP50_3470 [Actinoplanes sp. SE50/110]
MTALDWETFRDDLARSIASLPNSGALIVGDEERTECFVQFMLDYDHVVAEVASGMDPWDRPNLTEQEAAALEKLGWLPPPELQEHCNHGVKIAWPAPSAEYRRIADMSVTALRVVFGIPSPDSLVYKAFVVSATGEPLQMPRLGVPYRPDWRS